MRKIGIISLIALLGVCGCKPNTITNSTLDNVIAETNQIVDEGDSVTTIGDISILNPMVRELMGGQNNTVAYLDIENDGDADKLVSASIEGMVVELHSNETKDGMMQMRKIDAIEIPENSEVELGQGGYHLMIFNAPESVKAGSSLKIKLKFEKAGEVEIEAPVLSNQDIQKQTSENDETEEMDMGNMEGMDHANMVH